MGENNVSAAESAAVSAWLSTFEAALSKSDAKAAAALFADECYWRDLVSVARLEEVVEVLEEVMDLNDGLIAEPGKWEFFG